MPSFPALGPRLRLQGARPPAGTRVHGGSWTDPAVPVQLPTRPLSTLLCNRGARLRPPHRDGVRSWECAPPGLSRVSACPSQCGSGQLEAPEVTGRQWAGLAGGAVPGRRGQARESRGWRGADLAGPGPCPAFRPPGDPISRIQRNLCGLHFLRGLRRERSLECPQGRAEGRCRRPLQGPQPQAPFSAQVSPPAPTSDPPPAALPAAHPSTDPALRWGVTKPLRP